MKTKKLLIVTAIPPFPKDSGGAVRVYNTIRYLSEKFEIYLVSFKDTEAKLSEEEMNFLKEHTKFFTFFDKKPSPMGQAFFNTERPFWFGAWNSDELTIFLPKFIRDRNIDIVQIEFAQLLYLNDFIPKDVRKVYVAHDIAFLAFWRRIFPFNPLHIIDHLLNWLEIYLHEKRNFPKFDSVTAVSTKDKSTLQKQFNLKHIQVLPNGVEVINFLAKQKSDILKLGFIGSIQHSPNKRAIEFLIHHIFPLLEQRNIQFRVFIAGSNEAAYIANQVANSPVKNKKTILNLGPVKDVKDFYQNIDVLVAPIFSGSGSRIKILEALSFGVPVITTDIGREGLDIKSEYIRIANTKEEFVESIGQLDLNRFMDSSESEKLKRELEPLRWSSIFKNTDVDKN